MNQEISGVVGLDLSLTSTGIARITDKHVSYAVIPTTPKMSLGERWEKIIWGIRARIDVRDVIFIEDYAWGKAKKNESNVVTLAEISGLVKYIMWKLVKRMPIPVNPSVVKKWATGNHQAHKDDIKLGCYKKYGIEFKTSDEADAYAIADFGWHVCRKLLGDRRELSKWEEDMLARFTKYSSSS